MMRLKLRERQHDAGGMRHRAAGQAGAGAARHHRHFELAAGLEDPARPAPRSPAAPPPSAAAGTPSGRRIHRDGYLRPRYSSAPAGRNSRKRATTCCWRSAAGLRREIGESARPGPSASSLRRLGRTAVSGRCRTSIGPKRTRFTCRSYKAGQTAKTFYFCDTGRCHAAAIIAPHYTPQAKSHQGDTVMFRDFRSPPSATGTRSRRSRPDRRQPTPPARRTVTARLGIRCNGRARCSPPPFACWRPPGGSGASRSPEQPRRRLTGIHAAATVRSVFLRSGRDRDSARPPRQPGRRPAGG